MPTRPHVKSIDDVIRKMDLGYRARHTNLAELSCWPLTLSLTQILEPPAKDDETRQLFRRHAGSVNTVRWSDTGEVLVAAGDSLRLSLWSGATCNPLGDLPTPHSNNIFDALFVPHTNESKLVSCAADGLVVWYDVERSLSDPHQQQHFLNYRAPFRTLTTQRHMAVKCEFLPLDPNCFMTIFHHGRVTLIDLRTGEVEMAFKDPSTSCGGLSFNPLAPTQFAVATADPIVRLYDIRKREGGSFHCHDGVLQEFYHPELLNDPYTGAFQSYSPSAVQFNHSNQLLVNYSGYDLVLFDVLDHTKGHFLHTYTGRSNVDTFLKEARFFGNEQYILSGDDSGNLNIWEKSSTDPVNVIRADNQILNSVAVHPYLPRVACSGIDATVKILESELVCDVDLTLRPHETRPVPFPSRLPIITSHTASRNLSEAEALRNLGNDAYKAKNFDVASGRYASATRCLDFRAPSLAHQQKQQELMKLVHLNAAAVYVQTKNWRLAKQEASVALAIDPRNLKGLYRRAQAHYHLRRFREAKRDISLALREEPRNQQLLNLRKRINDAIPRETTEMEPGFLL